MENNKEIEHFNKNQLKLFETEEEKDIFMLSSKTAAKYKIDDSQTLRSQKVLILIFQHIKLKTTKKFSLFPHDCF